MIITCKKEIPFRWIIFAVLPYIAFTLNDQTMGVAFLFSLKKFVDNPAGLTFVLTLPAFISMLSVPIVNFISDRVWTRFGRRKPFVLSAWVGVATAFALMPLMPNFWSLLAVYLVYHIVNDIGGRNGPMEPLALEIVPPHQRGKSTGMNGWFSNLTTMSFFFFALGRFDDVRFMAGVPVSGEKVIYWSAGLVVATLFFVVALSIKEINQKSQLVGQRLNVKNFVTSLLDRELWPVFLLVFSSIMLNSSLGSLANLLYTDQWHYTKQEMGINVVIGGIINMFVIAYLAMIADKLNRMKAYQILIGVALAVKAAYFCYINYILPDHRPTLVELVVFGETLSIVGMLTGMVYTPLVFDYVRRNKMGTYMAGASLLGRVTYVTTLNGIGLFVWGYALVLEPPAGEMARVVLREEISKDDAKAIVRSASWTDAATGSPFNASKVYVNSWAANKMDLPVSRCWELRLRDKDSEKLAAEKEEIKSHVSAAASDEKALRDAATSLAASGKKDEAQCEITKADARKQDAEQMNARMHEIDAELTARATRLRDQASAVFGDRMLADGDQILGAKMTEALLVEIPTAARPRGARLEKILSDLRAERPDVIDLRPMKLGNGFGLAVSVVTTPDGNDAKTAGDIAGVVSRIAAKRDSSLFQGKAPEATTSRQPALTMDVMVVEEPLNFRVSPIMRVTNAILGLFDAAPQPDRVLSAVARNMRLPGESDHVRVYPAPNGAKAVSVVALLQSGAAKADTVDDPVGRKLQTLLPDGVLPQARAFYTRLETSAATKRVTLARPFVTAAYAPIHYDYMAGYICMFVLGLVGLFLTFQFQKLEKKGLIRKVGKEEAESV